VFVAESWETYDKLAFGEEDFGMKDLLEYKLQGSGKLTTCSLEVNAFINTEDFSPIPDVQIHFVSALVSPDRTEKKWIDKGSCFGMFDNDNQDDIANFPKNGMTIGTTLLHPESKGRIQLFSNNPLDPPIITTGFLTSPKDRKVLVEGMKFCRRIVDTETFKGIVKRPISDRAVPHPLESEEYLYERVKKSAATLYHPVGTCKMGPSNDRMAVVDPSLKVYGTQHLRVVDASIMPTITSGNTNIPVVMIAEKVADMIKTEHSNQ